MPRFFNPKERTPINEFEIDMWPGYSTEVKFLNDGIFLNIDTATKFISQRTVYDEIRDMQKNRYSNADITEELVPKDPDQQRIVVITLYNSRIYQPDGLTFQQGPQDIKFSYDYNSSGQRTKGSGNMVDYFNHKWGIKIDPRDFK